MIVNIKDITSAIHKVADITSGDKTIPGLMFKLYKNEADEGKLSICYSDGHKSLIEEINAIIEDTDHIGDIVVSFEQMLRAIGNCQPSGIIRVSDVKITYLENNIIRVSADQSMDIVDNEGNVVGERKLAVKKMDISWIEPGSDMRSSILNRMKYDTIFEPDGTVDTYERAELMDILSRTSVEKGKNVYISANIQEAFVANQAHVTSVPIKKNEISLEDTDIIRGELVERGEYTEEKFNEEVKKRENRVSQSVVIAQNIAKALIGILNKCSSDTVSVHRKDKYCNIIVENDTEKVGIWFEMAQASKAHIGSLERYSSLEYKNYQILFLREFLANNIKSALDSAKSDKVALRFEDTELEVPTCSKDLVIASTNAGASIADSYRVNPDDIVDEAGDIDTKQFNISLKVLSDMMAQIKTDYVAFDINVGENDTTCIRIAEVDAEKLATEYSNARKLTEKRCAETGVAFDPNTTPTPVDIKTGYRLSTLNVKQFTILSK